MTAYINKRGDVFKVSFGGTIWEPNRCRELWRILCTPFYGEYRTGNRRYATEELAQAALDARAKRWGWEKVEE
jgi:hypothetical protein